VPCVLLLSRSRDEELAAVTRLLGRVGVTVARVNADELADADLVVDPGRGAVRFDGTWLAPTVTWNRHFSPYAIEGAGSAARDLFRRESWQAVVAQLAALSCMSLGARRPGLLEQQELARWHGVATPRTVITTDPGLARQLLGTAQVVVKATDQHFVEATPGLLSGVFPAVVTGRQPLSASRPGIPVIVQEYVEHQAELRVYYVDGEVLGFEVGKQTPADLWLAADRVTVRQVPLPDPVSSATRSLAAGFKLRFGAYDFLVRDGAPVFLEVNPDGDWRWAEGKAGTRQVTTAVARMLRRLHREACARGLPAGCAPPGSLSLLRFLSAGEAGPAPPGDQVPADCSPPLPRRPAARQVSARRSHRQPLARNRRMGVRPGSRAARRLTDRCPTTWTGDCDGQQHRRSARSVSAGRADLPRT